MKILLFANTDWYLFNFRLPLARALRDCGAEVVLISPNGPYGHRLEQEGFRWVALSMNRRSVNPVREFLVLGQLVKLYRLERPDVVHHFTIKCVIYGSIAAYLSGVRRRINAVAGLGYVFASPDVFARVLRPLVRRLMKVALGGQQSRLIVQNFDDYLAFEKANLVEVERIRLIRGSGVNSTTFRPREHARPDPRPLQVFLAARLLWDKGIQEYVDASRELRTAGLVIEFLLAGEPDSGNPGAVPPDRVDAWQRAGVVRALGHVDNILPWLQQVDIAVLPSYYREGVPRSLIEAASCGLPIVTTDAPGCREIVEHEVNGLLVPCRDAKALAGAIQFLYDHPEERARMGAAGREKVLREFDERIVLAETLAVYRELMPTMFDLRAAEETARVSE